MTSRQEVLVDLKKQLTGSVKVANEILWSLVEKDHRQAAIDILPQVQGTMKDFELSLNEAMVKVAAQDEYYASQRQQAELQKVVEAEEAEADEDIEAKDK